MTDEPVVDMERLKPQPMFKTWQWVIGWIVVVAIIATFIFSGVQLYQQRQDQLKTSTTECARRITVAQQTVRDNMTTSKAKLDKDYVLAQIHVFRDPSAITDEVKSLERQATELDKRITAVEQLPDAAKEIERRCPG